MVVVADIDKNIMRNVVKGTYTERRKISLLNDEIWKLFVQNVIELFDVSVQNFC